VPKGAFLDSRSDLGVLRAREEGAGRDWAQGHLGLLGEPDPAMPLIHAM
jgi:hypothetical protein